MHFIYDFSILNTIITQKGGVSRKKRKFTLDKIIFSFCVFAISGRCKSVKNKIIQKKCTCLLTFDKKCDIL